MKNFLIDFHCRKDTIYCDQIIIETWARTQQKASRNTLATTQKAYSNMVTTTQNTVATA